jgi:hydrogenase maturation protein HypF
MIGGEQAIYQPWRNTYAHLMSAFEWEELQRHYGDLELLEFLQRQPRLLLNQMLVQGINSPLASSCGRLFDAVAAALNLCRERCSYEGQAAIALETLAEEFLATENGPIDAEQFAYSFTLTHAPIPVLESRPLWQALLTDLQQDATKPAIAARFHFGLAKAIVQTVRTLQQRHSFTHVALTGGVFQNCLLLQQVQQQLTALDFTVLNHSLVPPNDGGLSLGQAAIAAARSLPKV